MKYREMSKNYIFRELECQMAKGRELSISEDWIQFKMLYDRMDLPTGQVVRPQQILAGIALLGIQSELEI
ncbi:hypothetical protein LIA61_000998 [Vibrio parahaemolyticus]|nr:hypothetical protein [Vibrio parahaemolyticus]